MEIPTMILPDAVDFPNFEFELPIGNIPQYTPLVVPPSDLRSPSGVVPQTSTSESQTPSGMSQVNIPIMNVKVPVPESEILITAGTTAVISVAATLSATAAFKWLVKILKPILKMLWKKISGNKKPKT
ncbi:MAG: hypothetical protein CMG35_08290 [Candidatus Marinimicrobia bacterium]|nr:hypothetical protein [Candidatus Neomarinimicrobiota bacterium]|tara:strand:- start:36 stop:419 length:384 start_codon:yes stop_codon:yes gene_type:complete